MELYRVFQKNPAAVAKFGSGGGMVLSTDKAFPIKYWRRQIQNWQSIIYRDTKPLTVWSSYLENLENFTQISLLFTNLMMHNFEIHSFFFLEPKSVYLEVLLYFWLHYQYQIGKGLIIGMHPEGNHLNMFSTLAILEIRSGWF